MDLEARAHSEHPEELRLWLRLLTCTQLVEKQVRTALREQFDTTLPRFDLMAQLERAPDGLRMNELSRRMMVTGGNVTGITDLNAGGIPTTVKVRATSDAGVIEFDAVVVAGGTTTADLKLVILLQEAYRHCKAIGAWQPDTVIRRESYERMVDMWILAGHMKKRHPFERVVSNDLAEKIEREWKAGA